VGEYELIGILEYWIVDYLGLGGRRFIGNPKQPTISIDRLVDGEYEVRNENLITSPMYQYSGLVVQKTIFVNKKMT